MSLKFIINNIEYQFTKNNSNNHIIERVDGIPIDNRKEVARQFLRNYGYDESFFKNQITNALERKVYKILLNDGKIINKNTNVIRMPKTIKTNKNREPINMGNVILLNKPFLGGWLDKKGNIGHEIIDFLKTDYGDYYIYNNPWGVCPDDIWVDGTKNLVRNKRECYIGKYLVLTSEERGNDFDILYVIELEEKLHRYHTTTLVDKTYFRKSQEAMVKIMHDRLIMYNGKYLDKIYKDDDSLYVTFKGKRIYKAIEPILVTGLEYNFQRNKGYLYDDKFPDDYNYVENLINDSIYNGRLVEFTPRKANNETIAKLNARKTFLDLIALQDNEQVFTNMLYSILKQGDLLKRFCNRFKEDKFFDSNSTYNVFRETKVVDGRMDVCADGKNQRVIIENKVYSGLNGIKSYDNTTQLSTYYNWGKEKELEPLCFVIAPNFRIEEIKREIIKLDSDMQNIYLIKTYGDVASFIEDEFEKGNLNSSYEFYDLIPQIISAFRNLSYLTKEDLYARMFLEATN